MSDILFYKLVFKYDNVYVVLIYFYLETNWCYARP